MHAGERARPWKAPARQIPRRRECWSDRVAVRLSTPLTLGRRSWWRPSIWCRSRTQLIDRVWAAVASRRLSTAPSAGLMKAAAVCCPFLGLVDRTWSRPFACGSGRVDTADEQGLRREWVGGASGRCRDFPRRGPERVRSCSCCGSQAEGGARAEKVAKDWRARCGRCSVSAMSSFPESGDGLQLAGAGRGASVSRRCTRAGRGVRRGVPGSIR